MIIRKVYDFIICISFLIFALTTIGTFQRKFYLFSAAFKMFLSKLRLFEGLTSKGLKSGLVPRFSAFSTFQDEFDFLKDFGKIFRNEDILIGS